METELKINSPVDTNSLLDSKLQDLSSIKALKASKETLSDDDKAQYAKAARGFESMFVNMLLKEAKTGMFGGDTEAESGTFGADLLSGYTNLLFSDFVSQSGHGIGLAQMLYSQMTGGDQLKPTITKISKEDKKIDYKDEIDDFTPKDELIIEPPTSQNTNGNFQDRVKDRLANYNNIISNASKTYNVPENLIKAVITVESAGKNQAYSKVGAKGLMQLMDGTAQDLGVNNSYDPYQNIMGGTQYLRKMLDTFNNNTKLALAAYNSGPGNVQKYNGVPPFQETQAYVVKVLKYNKLYENEL